jgi:hypothetical protein
MHNNRHAARYCAWDNGAIKDAGHKAMTLAANDNIAPGNVYTLDEAAAHLRLTNRGVAKLARRHGLCMVRGRDILLTGKDIEGIKALDKPEAAKRVAGFKLKSIMSLPLSNMWETIRDTSVYVVKCDRFVKIGVAHNIGNRLRSLQAANPYKLELVHASQPLRSLIYAGIAERAAHATLSPSRVHGEWFKTLPSRAVKVVEACCEATRKLAIAHDAARVAA